MRNKWSRADTFAGIVFPASIGIGTGLGALIHNIGLGMSIGVALGTILSLLGYYRLKDISST